MRHDPSTAIRLGHAIIWPALPIRLYVPLSVLLEECPYDKHLEATQCDDQEALDDGKPDDPRLRRPHRRKIPVLPRPEVLLCASYVSSCE